MRGSMPPSPAPEAKATPSEGRGKAQEHPPPPPPGATAPPLMTHEVATAQLQSSHAAGARIRYLSLRHPRHRPRIHRQRHRRHCHPAGARAPGSWARQWRLQNSRKAPCKLQRGLIEGNTLPCPSSSYQGKFPCGFKAFGSFRVWIWLGNSPTETAATLVLLTSSAAALRTRESALAVAREFFPAPAKEEVAACRKARIGACALRGSAVPCSLHCLVSTAREAPIRITPDVMVHLQRRQRHVSAWETHIVPAASLMGFPQGKEAGRRTRLETPP